MATENVESCDSNHTNIFKELECYSWDDDMEFQGGLAAILGSSSSPDQIRELTIRAQCFYLSRKKNTTIDFDEYKSYLASKSKPSTSVAAPWEELPSTPQAHLDNEPPLASTLNDPKTAPYPKSFAEIVDLITSGAPIPGIRDIPDTLLTDQASKPVASKRRKPWEKDVDEETVQGGMGTFGDHRDTIIEQEYPTDA